MPDTSTLSVLQVGMLYDICRILFFRTRCWLTWLAWLKARKGTAVPMEGTSLMPHNRGQSNYCCVNFLHCKSGKKIQALVLDWLLIVLDQHPMLTNEIVHLVQFCRQLNAPKSASRKRTWRKRLNTVITKLRKSLFSCLNAMSNKLW